MKQGWEIKKLGEVCTFCSGYTPKEHEFKKCATIPVPYFKVSDMNHLENHKYLTYTTLYLENGCKTYPKHTIVFPKNGAAIATNKKRLLGQDSVVDLNTGGVIANDKIVFYEYLYLFLLNLDFRLFTRRGAVPTLDIAELKKQAIPVPPLPVQEQIVSELDLLSSIIEKKREQLKELDALAQSIFYDMFGDPITNEKGWEVKKLGEVCEVTSFKRVLIEEVVETGIPFIRGTELTALSKLPNSKDYPFTLFITKEHYERVKAISGVPTIGDLLIPSINSEGLIWELDTDEPRYYKDGRVLWVHTNHKYNYSKALKYILSNKLRMMYNELASGATFIELKLFVLRDIELPFPPLPLQHQFASKIEAIERQKELIKQSISETETLFNERMQHYFS